MENRKVRRKNVKMVRCPNCGAQYEEGLLYCPYCRSVDDYQDESEYLEDLDEIKDQLEDMPENVLRDQTKAQTAEAARDIGRIFRRIGIAVAVILLLAGVFTFFDKVVAGNSEAGRSEKQKQEYLWKQENFPKLDEMYEKGDYDGILELARSSDNPGLYDWKHYPLVDGLQILEYIPTQIRSLEEMEQAGNTGKASYLDQQTSLLRDELMLLYFDYRQAEEADVAIIREKAEVYIEDLQTRFALTQEEQEHFRELARKDRGYIYLSDCRDFLKNR